ncbi:efflux RND transporter periplasmic adaptor subunit [Vibrio navarrensis]|uniref:efflux RND transporter periplasmic adaptor subunit n=1 Tax=Vibrio navarrensis TaxID=29495 RepID=UPI001869EBC7|nr:efflux RND transporter periplasmic adaptor subunit [Vibrio navarrensis]MBE4588250.1 efflux transporter periplasmic adaptor subunit [Vibrio navarrensis]
MQWLKKSALAAALLLTTNSSAMADVYTAQLTKVDQAIVLDGVVQPVNQGTVAAQTSGTVVALNVDVNDYVKQGSVLLEISAVQQSAALDAAKAQLASAVAQNKEAQAQVKRFRQLMPKGAISQDQMDAAETRARSAAAAVKSAEASVAQAKESLGYTSVTAPYDGVVTKRYVELGETVAPGTPLLSGFSMDELRVESEIPQHYYSLVNNEAQFTIDNGGGEKVTPTTYNLFRYAEPSSHSHTIRLNLPEKQLGFTPGAWVKTRFVYGQRELLLVPKTAVMRRAELSVVYRLTKDDEAILNPVRLGQEFEDSYEVLSGLEIGDRVVSNLLKVKGE